MARPTLQTGYLGPKEKFSELGLSTVSHPKPEIDTNCSTLQVQLRSTMALKVTATLVICQTEQETKDYIFSQTEEDGKLTTLIVNLPSPGYFKLQIFALPSNDDSKSLPNVYNYLINNMAPAGHACCFPKQFAQWKDGCFLCKPYDLEEGDSAQFEVKVPKAKAVAVTLEKEWFHFTKGSDDVWRGEVKGLSAHRGKGKKAMLNANFVDDKTKYTSLLEYSV